MKYPDSKQSHGWRLSIESLEHRCMLAVGELVLSIEDASTAIQSGSETGFSVAVDDGPIVAGSPGDDIAGLSNVGQVQLYDPDTGSLLRTIANPSPSHGDRFGTAIDIAGQILVVGAHLDDTTAIDGGTVYVFDMVTGTLTFEISNPTPGDFDYFGHAVAIAGNQIIVGAYLDDTSGQDAGIAYAFDAVSGNLTHTFLNPTPSSFDYFGFSVSAASTVVAVGMPRNDTGETDAGAVYLFDATSGGATHTIHNPTPAKFDYFGDAIAVTDETLVIGAYREDTGAVNAGAAYIYDTASATLQQTLVNPAPTLADNFGFAVAVDENTVIVGSYRDDLGATNSGVAYQYNATTGALEWTFANPTPDDNDYFGSAVAVHGEVAVTTAYWDDTLAIDSGMVYSFDTITGLPQISLASPTPASFNFFGSSVSASGNLLAVGSYLDDTHGTDAGIVQVFDSITGALLQTIASPSPSEHDNFGYAVALSSDLLAVGVYRADAGATDSGIVYVFDVVTGALTQTLANPSPTAFDAFGISVSISGSTVAVGASGKDSGGVDSGIVYTFDGPTGLLLATIENPSPADFDRFGNSVSMADDRLIAGAASDNNGANNSGAAYVFDANNGSLVSTLVDPAAAEGDAFGQAVSLFGTVAVVGAPNKDLGASGAGGVLVFDATTGTLVRTISSPQPANNGRFGYSVASSSEFLAIGAIGEQITSISSGAAYLFDTTTGAFVSRLEPPNPEDFDSSGLSVSLGASIVAVGAPLVDGSTTDRGAVHLFEIANQPPQITVDQPTVTADEGTLATVSGTFDDPGTIDIVTLAASVGTVVDNGDGTWTWSYDTTDGPDDSQTVTITVTDDDLESASVTFELAVENLAPTLSIQQATLHAGRGQLIENTGLFADPGLDTVELSASHGTIVDNGDGIWSWTWQSHIRGTTTITITATDGDGAMYQVTFDVVVGPQPATDFETFAEPGLPGAGGTMGPPGSLSRETIGLVDAAIRSWGSEW